MSCVVKEQRVIKLSLNLSGGYFFPHIWRGFCLRGCFEHICSSSFCNLSVHAVEQHTLWLGISILLGYFAHVVQENKGTWRWGERITGSELRDK